jgi:hypothetical protein
MKRIGLSIFDALHKALVKSATKNHRSLHGEIIYALIEYVKSQGFEVSEKDLPSPIPANKRA